MKGYHNEIFQGYDTAEDGGNAWNDASTGVENRKTSDRVDEEMCIVN